jgi:hypothetical protein
MTGQQSGDLMVIIRRRTAILKLFPYFNWKEVLPIKAPRPLREIEQMFRDLPPVSVQRKIVRERTLHVHAKVLLIARRTMRDFFRAYASFVQTQIAARAVIKLMRQKQTTRSVRFVFDSFKANWQHVLYEPAEDAQVRVINADIAAWFNHFFRERVRQQRLALQIPYS